MPLYNHRSSALIGKAPLPVTLSDQAQRHTAHVHSVGTNKAKKVAKQLTVKARRWK